MELIEKRVSDRSVLKLIRMWLKCPFSEEQKDKGCAGKSRIAKIRRKLTEKLAKSNGSRGVFKLTKPTCGTPQGGVISPLLANIFLNELDKAFHCQSGSPLYFANARLIRYADDCVPRRRIEGQSPSCSYAA